MKLLTVNNKGFTYEFRYLEQAKVVEISKDEKLTYMMEKVRSGDFRCSCPGSRYHHKCWHTGMLSLLLSQQSVNEPWVKWAEEAGVVQYLEGRR